MKSRRPSTRAPRRRRLLALLALSATLSACVVVPQTRHVYDPACGVATKQITLEVGVLPGFYNCQGDACVALMVTAGVVTVTSAVISGSVAVVGNVLYWAERRGQCPFPQKPAA